LFAKRVAAHRARDGHGDLLADDVFCLPDGPRIRDCLEFDDQLRYGDGLADAAFLAMDLERLHRPDLARRFLDSYREAAHDEWPSSLEHFYVAMRAHVRAKVAAIRDDDRAAADLMHLALSHLERGRVRLVLVGGSPATGKTTLARAVAAATGFDLLRSDVVRKELSGLSATDAAPAPLDAGLYSPPWTGRTYEALGWRAARSLALGRSVILDASWATPETRALAQALATNAHAELIAVRCIASEEVAAARAAQRTAAHDASDAGPRIAVALAHRFAPWRDAHDIDTERPQAEAVATALSHLGPF
jgi:predicted kinase